jgi:hypothetical protein
MTGRVYRDDHQHKIKEGRERYQGRIASWNVEKRKKGKIQQGFASKLNCP